MARFIGYLRGNRKLVSRLGHATSGLNVSASGWNAGVNVHAYALGERDIFLIEENGGSNGHRSRQIAVVEDLNNGDVPTISYGEGAHKATDLERQLFNVLQSIEAAWSRGENAQALYWADVRKVIEAAEAL